MPVQERQDRLAALGGQREREAAGRQLKYRRLKQVLLASIFTVSFLQYYFVDVQLDILKQKVLTVFVSY